MEAWIPEVREGVEDEEGAEGEDGEGEEGEEEGFLFLGQQRPGGSQAWHLGFREVQPWGMGVLGKSSHGGLGFNGGMGA